MLFAPTAAREWLREYIDQEAETLLVSLRLYVIRAGLAAYASAPAVASDLLNEMVVEALRHADRLNSADVTRAWLLGIAVNLIKRKRAAQIKRDYREPLARDICSGAAQETMSDDEIFDRLAPRSAANPAQDYEANERITAILAGVSEDDQEIIRLAILNEMTGVMIAEKLNITPEAARKRLQRALKRLRKAHGCSTGLDD